MTAGPYVALMGMILESNRFSRPANRADFESLTWLRGNALLDEARKPAPTLAREFADLWRAGDAPDVFEFLRRHPDGPPDHLTEVVLVDQTQRAAAADTLPAEAYLDALPEIAAALKTPWERRLTGR